MSGGTDFFSLHLELRRSVYEYLFHELTRSLDNPEKVELQRSVSQAHQQPGTELTESTSKRLALFTSIKVSIKGIFDWQSAHQEKLLDLEQTLRCDALRGAEIFINYWRQGAIVELDDNDYAGHTPDCCGQMRLHAMQDHMKRVVEVLNYGCEQIEVPRVRYSPKWRDTSGLRLEPVDRFGSAEPDSSIPRELADNVRRSYKTVLEYVLRPLQGLKKGGCVDMELHERAVTDDMIGKDSQRAQRFKEYQKRS